MIQGIEDFIAGLETRPGLRVAEPFAVRLILIRRLCDFVGEAQRQDDAALTAAPSGLMKR